MKTINNDLIRSFSPCYDPSEKVKDETENLPVKDWVEKYRCIVPGKDIVWLLCRNEFLTDKDMRLFAVWCTRESLKLDSNPDKRSINACNVAERFANGDATSEELAAAYAAAGAAGDAAAAAMAAASDAAWAAASAAADAYAARKKQVDKLLTYLK